MVSTDDVTKSHIADIANSIIDGSDALLLPRNFFSNNSLLIIDAVCKEAEAAIHQRVIFREIKDYLKMPMEAIYSLAISVLETSFKSNAAAIICLTASGRTARVLTR